jgi:Ca2+-binding RTX toxin-like protein
MGTVNVAVLAQAVGSGGFTVGTDVVDASFALDGAAEADIRLRSRVAKLAGGGSVIVWASYDSDGSGNNVYMEVLDAAGAVVKATTRVNALSSDDQNYADVVGLADGGFAVAYYDDTPDNGRSAKWRRFDASGNGIGGEVRILPVQSGSGLWDNPQVTLVQLLDGNIATIWSGRLGPSDYQIYMTRFTLGGAVLDSTPILVNTTTSGYQVLPRAAVLSNGNIALLWDDAQGNDGGSHGVYLQIMSPSGAKVGSEILVNTTTVNAQEKPDVAALVTGGLIATWTGHGQDGSGTGVYAQRFTAAGVKVGSEFLVNVTTANEQRNASVTALADGGFYIAWMSFGQDGSDEGIYGKRFDINGNSVGGEAQIHAGTSGKQYMPDITELSNGDLLASFQSWHSGVPQVMHVRLAAPAGLGVYNETGTAADEILVGNIRGDTLNGGAGADTLVGGAGNDFLIGGLGNDTYRLASGFGADIIDNQDADNSGLDMVAFEGAGLGREDLWFEKDGYDLKVRVLGATDALTVQNWYVNDAQKVDKFQLDDGHFLLADKVNALVDAMASFNPQGLGPITALGELPQGVQSAIVASWT